jgi:hypothetical protein
MNKKVFAIIVLVVVLVGIVGYFVVRNNNEKTLKDKIAVECSKGGKIITEECGKLLVEYRTYTGPVGVNQSEPNIQPFVDEIINWKTYTNNQYGFEIKYPSYWYSYPINSLISGTMLLKSEKLPDIGATEFAAYGDQISVSINLIAKYDTQGNKNIPITRDEYIKWQFPEEGFEGPGSLVKKWVKINGLDMLQVVIAPAGNGHYNLQYVYFKDDKNLYSFDLWPYEPNEKDQTPEMKQNYNDFKNILSTFKFTK